MYRQVCALDDKTKNVRSESGEKSAIKINRKAIKGEALECERARYNLRANCGAEEAQNDWQQVTTKLFLLKCGC